MLEVQKLLERVVPVARRMNCEVFFPCYGKCISASVVVSRTGSDCCTSSKHVVYVVVEIVRTIAIKDSQYPLFQQGFKYHFIYQRGACIFERELLSAEGEGKIVNPVRC